MSLPALEWRKLPVRTFQVTQSVSTMLTTIADMITGSAYSDGSVRVPGSGSAWSTGSMFFTGSNAEALYCFPPLKTELTQSVIFSGKQPNGASSSATPYMATNETYASAGPGYLYVASAKLGASSSVSAGQWTSIYPYGSSSYSTGYASFTPQLSNVGSSDKISIYESKEAIAVFIYRPGTTVNYGAIAGAIVDPEQSNPTSSFDAEVDGRLYGILTSGTTAINAGFLTNSSAIQYFLTQQNASGVNPKFQLFTPSISPPQTTMAVAAEKTNSTSTGFYPTRNYTTISGKFIKTPLKCVRYDSGTPSSYIGRLRDISSIRNSLNGLTIRDNTTNTVSGFSISASENSANYAILLNYS